MHHTKLPDHRDTGDWHLGGGSGTLVRCGACPLRHHLQVPLATAGPQAQHPVRRCAAPWPSCPLLCPPRSPLPSPPRGHPLRPTRAAASAAACSPASKYHRVTACRWAAPWVGITCGGAAGAIWVNGRHAACGRWEMREGGGRCGKCGDGKRHEHVRLAPSSPLPASLTSCATSADKNTATRPATGSTSTCSAAPWGWGGRDGNGGVIGEVIRVAVAGITCTMGAAALMHHIQKKETCCGNDTGGDWLGRTKLCAKHARLTRVAVALALYAKPRLIRTPAVCELGPQSPDPTTPRPRPRPRLPGARGTASGLHPAPPSSRG